jgi:hypothetical protein
VDQKQTDAEIVIRIPGEHRKVSVRGLHRAACRA